MYKDATLVMADAETGTTSGASTSYIDAKAAGNAYVGAWFVVGIDIAFTVGAGAPTATFQLQTSNDANFIDATTATVCQSSALLAAALTIDTLVFKTRIPPGTKRYLRAYKVVDSGAEAKRFVLGKWDAFIVKDVDMDIDGGSR